MSRVPLTGDLEIKQGATWVMEFYYVDSTGTAINLTGYTARLQIRSDYESTTTLASLTSPSGGLVITGASGLVTATISAADTAALPAGQFVYDLEIISSGGVVTRMAEGPGVISREVTR